VRRRTTARPFAKVASAVPRHLHGGDWKGATTQLASDVSFGAPITESNKQALSDMINSLSGGRRARTNREYATAAELASTQPASSAAAAAAAAAAPPAPIGFRARRRVGAAGVVPVPTDFEGEASSSSGSLTAQGLEEEVKRVVDAAARAERAERAAALAVQCKSDPHTVWHTPHADLTRTTLRQPSASPWHQPAPSPSPTTTAHGPAVLSALWLPDGALLTAEPNHTALSVWDEANEMVQSYPLPASATRGTGLNTATGAAASSSPFFLSLPSGFAPMIQWEMKCVCLLSLDERSPWSVTPFSPAASFSRCSAAVTDVPLSLCCVGSGMGWWRSAPTKTESFCSIGARASGWTAL
jgi:hypothetical protein